MSGHAYTEDQLIEQPAIGLFATLGWQTESALEEIGLSPLSSDCECAPLDYRDNRDTRRMRKRLEALGRP